MIDTLYAILLSLGTAIGGGFSGWLFSRKKYNTEVDFNIIQNKKSLLDLYKEIIEDNELRLQKYLDKLEILEKQNQELLVQNNKLKASMEELLTRFSELMDMVCINLTCTKRCKINENGIKNNKKIQEA